MLQLHMGKLRLFTTVFALSTGVAATTTGCGKSQSGSASATADAEAAQPAAPAEILDLADAYEVQQLLVNSKTRLELTQAEFLSLKSLLPSTVTALTEGLVPPEKIAKIWIKDGEDLMRIALTEPSFVVDTPAGKLTLSETVAVKRIVQPDAAHPMHVITVSGMAFQGQGISSLYLLKDGTLRLQMADGTEKSAESSILKQVFANPESVAEKPTSAQIVKALFAGTFAVRTASGDNVAHLNMPEGENAFVKRMKDQLAASDADPRLIKLLDKVTDIYIDKTGIQIWLTEGVNIQTGSGEAMFASYVKLASTNATTIVPVQGVSAIAYEADGAQIQQFRYQPLTDGSARLDIDVYGWKQTLFGQFGQNQTVSIAL